MRRNSKDVDVQEARRVAALVLRAMQARDNKAAADLIRTCDNPYDLANVGLSLCSALLAERMDPDAFIDAFLMFDAPNEWYAKTVSASARARQLLRQELSDGERHSYVSIRALALSEGIKTKDLQNAAQQLGVVSSGTRAKDTHWWQLPNREART